MRVLASLLLASVSLACFADPPPAEVARPRPADQILNQYCNVCHATGWNGAPISGDENEWAPRVKNGFDALLKNARDGINTMPPKGACADCTDVELKAAIEAM